MKGVSVTVAIIVIIVALVLILISNYSIKFNNSTFCVQNNDCIFVCGSCENINYFNSHPKIPCAMRSNQIGNDCICENNQCIITAVSTTTVTQTTTTSVNNVDLDALAKNPALYVSSYIKARGQVVKSVGAFFGDTYYLQSDDGIRNFKSLSESSTGIAIASENINFENYVGYTFNGTGYSIAPLRFFYVDVSGYVIDRGMIVDAARYVLVVNDISDHPMV